MAKILTTSLTRYELNAEEEIRAAVLTPEQKMGIQNELAQIAEQQLAIKIDPQNPLAAMQEQSYLSGQTDILKFLFTKSEVAESQLREVLASRQQIDPDSPSSF